jgi:hypothetical protein
MPKGAYHGILVKEVTLEKMKNKIRYIINSANRLEQGLKFPAPAQDATTLEFLRRESRLLLRRSVSLFLHLHLPRKKG